MVTSPAEYAPVADRAVVADVGLGHDEVVAADFGVALLVDGAVDDDVLVDLVVVADAEEGLFAVPAEVLRVGAYHGTLEDLVVMAEDGVVEHGGVGADLAVVADDGVAVDEGESVDLDVVAELGGRVYECHGVNDVGHRILLVEG